MCCNEHSALITMTSIWSNAGYTSEIPETELRGSWGLKTYEMLKP